MIVDTLIILFLGNRRKNNSDTYYIKILDVCFTFTTLKIGQVFDIFEIMGNANDEELTPIDDNTVNGENTNNETTVDYNVADECEKPTNNPFLNFLYVFRRRNKESHCKPTELMRKGAAMWRSMSAEEKKPYQDLAEKVKAQGGVKRKRIEKEKQEKRNKRRKVEYSSSDSSTFYSVGETNSRSYISARTSSFDTGTVSSCSS